MTQALLTLGGASPPIPTSLAHAITFAAAAAAGISWAQAASGAGGDFPIRSQQGAAGSVGGTFTLGGGDGGTPGTNLAGDTRIFLGQTVANVSARFRLLVGATPGTASSVFDISQTSASSLTLTTNGNNLAVTASGASISPTCGAFSLRATSVSGCSIRVDAGAFVITTGAGPTTMFTADTTGLGFYSHATVAQPARVGQLTDSTAGTPGTTLAAVGGTTYATDIATIRNWAASLAQRINALEAVLHGNGLTA